MIVNWSKVTFLSLCKVWVPPVRDPVCWLVGLADSIGNRGKSNGVGRSEAGSLVPLESLNSVCVFFFMVLCFCDWFNMPGLIIMPN